MSSVCQEWIWVNSHLAIDFICICDPQRVFVMSVFLARLMAQISFHLNQIYQSTHWLCVTRHVPVTTCFWFWFFHNLHVYLVCWNLKRQVVVFTWGYVSEYLLAGSRDFLESSHHEVVRHSAKKGLAHKPLIQCGDCRKIMQMVKKLCSSCVNFSPFVPVYFLIPPSDGANFANFLNICILPFTCCHLAAKQ